MKKNSEFILEPTDKWLIAKTIESVNSDNVVLFGEFNKKYDVVIKMLKTNYIEYKIYKILYHFMNHRATLQYTPTKTITLSE